ncbi:MAG TPA: hypothetical protein PLP03_09430 [Bacteroidales bacterium]|jgi:hypothetical protein|nr:hypothetical protein [Bacteroidales bacterium]
MAKNADVSTFTGDYKKPGVDSPLDMENLALPFVTDLALIIRERAV